MGENQISNNMKTPLLQVTDLRAGYGKIEAVKGVSLTINDGEIVTVLGANGAGKSTLLKVLAGGMKPTAGTIEYMGKPRAGKPYQIVESGLVIVPEGRQVFTKLTVLENLRVGGNIRKDRSRIDDDIERMYSLFPRLREREKNYGGTLSGGEQQMLAIARGLMMRPRLLMLDEPSLGLAPVIVKQIFEILKTINEQGTSLLLIEQNAHMALRLCDRAYIMSTGKVVLEGKGADLLKDGQLTEAYLG